ncbi:MAG: PD-(D/E)XK nuclease family protein [Bacteroidia bacterium]
MTFLEHISQDLHQRFGQDIARCCLVVPSRRAVVFLKRALAATYRETIWAPQIASIQDLVRAWDGRQFPEAMTLIFELYQAYTDHIRRHNPRQTPERFEQFYSWGEMLVRDFDELDKYLVDARQLFTNVRDLREIDAFMGLADEQREAVRQFWQTLRGRGDEPGEMQQRFLRIWETLFDVYEAYRARLRTRQMAYDGMAYRDLVEGLDTFVLPCAHIVFIGFNALSTAEERLFRHLLREQQATVYWDVDRAYFTPPGEQTRRWATDGHIAGEEPGKFIRTYHRRWSPPYDSRLVIHDMCATPKTIYITGVALQSGQAEYLGNILRDLPPGIDLSRRAVVLADENLLFPTLYALPRQIGTLNITMGFPLRQTHIYHLLMAVIRLLRQVQYDAQRQPVFSHRAVMELLSNPYLRAAAGPEVVALRDEIRNRNLVLIHPAELARPALPPLLRHIFAPPALDQPWHTLQAALLDYVEAIFTLLLDDAAAREAHIEAEYSYQLFTQYNLLRDLLQQYQPQLSVPGFTRMLQEVLQRARIPFEGEPLAGLQLMGFLETRVLDFEAVYILGANEGKLPDTSTGHSFVPYQLRRGFGLPTYEEKDAIYAYHFYRLLQRAGEVHLIYNTVVKDSGGAQEISRFIRQLRHFFRQHPQVQIVEQIVSTAAPYVETQPIHIPIDAAIRARLAQRFGGQGYYSATALSTYVLCPLRFYFRYVADVREPEAVEEQMEAGTFGKVFHRSVELLYSPLVGKDLDEDMLRGIQAAIPACMQQAFAESHLGWDTELRGNNLLLRDVIASLVGRVVAQDIDRLPFRIVYLEESGFERQLTLDGTTYRIGGAFDRVDQVADGIHILDYKTGQVEIKAEVPVERFMHEPQYKAMLQGYLYAWLYQARHPGATVRVGYYTARAWGRGIQYLDAGQAIGAAALSDFDQELGLLLRRIATTDFTQTADEQACSYCPYRDICAR